MTDPKVRELLRKLKEVGLTADDLNNISKLNADKVSDLLAQFEQNKKEK